MLRRLALTSWVLLAFGCGLPEGGLGETDDAAPAAPVIEASAPPFHDAGLAPDAEVEASSPTTGAGDAAAADHEAGAAPDGGSAPPGKDDGGDNQDNGDDGGDPGPGPGQGKSK